MTFPKTSDVAIERVAVSKILAGVDSARAELIKVVQDLVRVPSETPPSDTRAIARVVAKLLSGLNNIRVSFHPSETPVENLVAMTRGSRPGKRLILNGHLDTYPAGDSSLWTDDPFSGVPRDGKIFGRGSVDMKGGIACSLLAFKLLAQNQNLWAGELVMTLAGDEESMGTLGSQFLLDTVPEARGDAMLCGDVGSPLVPRIGEKGMIWIDISAFGKVAHGAHVHRGINAIDLLRAAMDALSQLSDYTVQTPKEVAQVIADAKSVSESLSGFGEASVLERITVNFGRISGGETANLVAGKAEVNADIRIPLGVSVVEVEAEIHRLLSPINGIQFKINRRYEATWTPPGDPIVQAIKEACYEVLGQHSSINMRVGASDARLYRAAGIPTVVCGLTPNNLGGPDEFVKIDELVSLAKIHTLTALKFLALD